MGTVALQRLLTFEHFFSINDLCDIFPHL